MQLTSNEKETIKSILRHYVPQAEYLAFGSRVKGTAKKFSDIDVAVKSKQPIPLSTLS